MTTFTVTCKGEEITFESYFDCLDTATNYIAQESKYHQSVQSDFVMSLLGAKNPSGKQIAWIHYLATQDMIDSQTPASVGEYLPLVKKMYDGVKSPRRKFQVRIPGVTLSTVTKGGNVGNVYVFENDVYVGKITENGVPVGKFSEDVKNLLIDANDNLLQLAKMYGHETGVCSICSRTLSDPLSIQMGIGPICAKRFS